MDNCIRKNSLFIWHRGSLDSSKDEPFTKVPVLQMEDVIVTDYAIGKSRGTILSDDKKCFQIGCEKKETLTLASIEASLCEVSLLKSIIITKVSCGYHHSAALTQSGAVYCWGDSNDGQCGTVADCVREPFLIQPFSLEGSIQFESVTCGKTHTMAISVSGELWGWGRSQMVGGKSSLTHDAPMAKPELVEHLCGRRVLQVSCGKYHTVVLAEEMSKTVSSPGSSTICSICNQETFKMFDNDDKVIISDTHICTTINPKNHEPQKKKLLTHNRSSSLPFLNKSNTLSSRRERTGESPISPLFLPISKSVSSKSLELRPRTEQVELESISKSHLESSKIKDSERDLSHSSVTKSMSSPETTSQMSDSLVNGGVSLPNVNHESTPNSSQSPSPSIASLDDCKSRMTLPLNSVGSLNISDTKSALAYLEQLSPEESYDSGIQVSNVRKKTDFNESLAKIEEGSDTKKKSISEQITQTITDNQILSPLTSYSKNVFTGVMDSIEWIKSSTYDNVAPFRDFLSKDKIINKDESSNGTAHVDPLRSTTPVSQQDGSTCSLSQLTLRTEVWTWGNNDKGQLGMSDSLDRFQPTVIKPLSGRGIVKVSCGAQHTLALSSNSEVYSWGCNTDGQLGRSDSSERNPVKIECKNCVWDIAGGKSHSLFLTDGISEEPTILMCGSVNNEVVKSHPLNGDEKLSKKFKLHPVYFSKNMGFHCCIISSFSNLSSCLSEQQPNDLTSTIHALAKSERQFYHQVTLIKSGLLRPLKFSDLYKILQNTKFEVILLEALELFGRLSYNIGLNTVQLNKFIISGKDCDENTFSYMNFNLLSSFEKYFTCLNNMIAIGFFEKCAEFSVKQCKFLSKESLTQVFKDLLGEKRLSLLSSENFLQTLQLPATRFHDYSVALNKLSAITEEKIPLSLFLEDLAFQWESVRNKVNNGLQSANNTRNLWKTDFKTSKLSRVADGLKKPGRFLILNSKKIPLDLVNAGRFSSNWFLLFNDCLVLMTNSTPYTYPLQTLWCTPQLNPDEKSHSITICTPEEEFVASSPNNDAKTKWITSINRAINSTIWRTEGELSPSKESKQYHRPPPSIRHACYTYLKDPELKGASYDGAWLNGKPNGKGQLKWQDGKSYEGNFKDGKHDGYGEWKAATDDKSKLRYHGWWKDGKMDGHGKLWYNKFQVYEGAFKCGVREGHGVLRTGSVTEGSVYVGAWKNDQRHGFGIEDNITKGEKYIGMWNKNERHGVGILVTLDGLFGQSCFYHGNMSGDTLLIEGRYVFEGAVSQGLTLSGKGRLTLPNGDKLEGSFSGFWGSSIRISGGFHKTEIVSTLPFTPDSPKTPMEVGGGFTVPSKDHARNILRRYNRHIMKRLNVSKDFKPFPLCLHPDVKWKNIFLKCRSSLKCPLEETGSEEPDTKKIWDALSVSMSTAKRTRTEIKYIELSPEKKLKEDKLIWLERVPSVVTDDKDFMTAEDIKSIKEYLVQAFNAPLHPLGELAESLSDVYRDSYSGAGAHKWLLAQAVADVRSFVRRAYDILRCLFPLLGKEHNASHMKIVHDEADADNYEDFNDAVVTAGDLLLPVLLPRVYPTLFTLYALRHENEDRTYWERVTRLNRHPDIALLSFLGVKPKFWLLDEKEIPPLESAPNDGQLYDNVDQAESSKWRHLLVATAKDCSFLSAIETLQLISTTFIPAEKLNVIQSTFKHINDAVFDHHKQTHSWSMDDLFPVFQYVVVRARISHLGCEIQLIEDFLEPDLCKGEKGIMFTTLKACYFQIRVEKNL